MVGQAFIELTTSFVKMGKYLEAEYYMNQMQEDTEYFSKSLASVKQRYLNHKIKNEEKDSFFNRRATVADFRDEFLELKGLNAPKRKSSIFNRLKSLSR